MTAEFDSERESYSSLADEMNDPDVGPWVDSDWNEQAVREGKAYAEKNGLAWPPGRWAEVITVELDLVVEAETAREVVERISEINETLVGLGFGRSVLPFPDFPPCPTCGQPVGESS